MLQVLDRQPFPQVKTGHKNRAFLDSGTGEGSSSGTMSRPTGFAEGEECLAALYVDKSSRLCATHESVPLSSTRTPYGPGDMVKGRVYEISGNFVFCCDR